MCAELIHDFWGRPQFASRGYCAVLTRSGGAPAGTGQSYGGDACEHGADFRVSPLIGPADSR
uniref:U296l n=1 Tax=Mycobacterium leprae TaxID=1769 RepID=Q50154_MYCLR|nr:u296l [Mycobacterium leprae]